MNASKSLKQSPSPDLVSYRPATEHLSLGDAFFETATPADFPKTVLRYQNQRWADRVGLSSLSQSDWERHFGRFEPLADNLPEPLAMKYHGHQFQSYNPDLGDGRGFLFAQLYDGQDGRLLDLATKGSGTTSFSRAGDGRLTLKGGVREALATALLEALGVYTSKSFALIETGESLHRGDEPSPTRSAVLTRLGHSHIRFGTFQRLAYHQDRASMKRLVDYICTRYFAIPLEGTVAERAEQVFARIVDATARMGAQWFVAGFVHGVLNTDNMNINGESFDYGPYRFLPTFDPSLTAAYFDHTGLYAFGRQPNALGWNLQRLAQTLLLVEANSEALTEALKRFPVTFDSAATGQMLWRLGLVPRDADEDADLVRAALKVLQTQEIGFDAFFHSFRGKRSARGIDNDTVAEFEAARDSYLANDDGNDLFDRTDQPVSLLYDEIEAIWSSIASDDDWTGFHSKLAAIEDLRVALQPAESAPNS